MSTRRGRLLGLVVASAATLALAGAAVQRTQASGPSDLIDVISLAGTSSSAQAVSVVPILSTSGAAGTVGAPTALPTAASGSQNPIGESGSASSEGFLNLSGNGQYLTLAGYAATPGTSSVASTASSSTRRVAARIDGSGNIDTSTALNAFTGNNVRDAVTDDGSHIWLTGAGSGDSPKTAVYAASFAATTGNGIVTPSPTGARDLVIAGGNLYLSTTTTVTPGIYKVGSGLPTSGSQSTAALVTGATLDPYGFALVQLGAGPGVDTLYVADGTAGGITKYSLVGGSWVAKGTVGLGTKLFGLAAKAENGGVQLYATTATTAVAGNAVVSFFDSSGAGATISSGSFTTVATAPGSTTYRGVAFAPTGQTLSAAPPTITLADSALSRSIGDSYDPNQTTATVSDSVYAASQLTVTATSDNPAVVPSVAVTGSGSTRTLTVTSNDAVGLANVTVTVSTPDGRSASTVLQYGVSAAAPDSTSTFLYDFSNASTAIDAGDGYYIVGDDEFNQPALYQGGVSGQPITTWNFDSQMGVADTSQIDIEASARFGNTIYWFGSEGNNSDGSVKANRAIVFATTITGTGASTQLTFAGFYKNLRNDLLAWDAANGNQFGFAAGAADGQIPKEANGFNIEGAEFAAGGSSTLYLGFRAPIVPTSNRTSALVVPLINLSSLISSSGNAGSATFGAPIYWRLTPPEYVNPFGDTSALGIREIRKNADDQYLIIAGSYEEVPPAPSGGAEFLYTWNGDPLFQPVLTSTVLPTPDDGSWETVVSVPDPLTDGSTITMIQDDGDNDLYDTGQEAKDLTGAPSQLQKDRADIITVALPSQSLAFASTPPAPAYTGTTYDVSATASALGNDTPIVFNIDPASTPGTCSISGTQVSLLAPGTCVVDADKAGNFQFAAGHVTQSFGVQLPSAPVVTVPSEQTLEATGPSGAAASFSASAVDVVDGSLTATCAPASGSTFALGTTTVTCSATDSQGVTGTASFSVIVQDTTPPVLSLPSDQVLEATGPAGAVASFGGSASDIVDGTDPVSCLPASGSTFPVGATTVDCSATDAHGNTATGSFSVTVQDTTAPVLTLPNVAVDATGPAGAAVVFSGATATDLVDGTDPVVCVPPSGSTFPIGTTAVACSATDAHGNTAAGSFTVTVTDTPILHLPGNLVVEAIRASGARVTFAATASDPVDGSDPVSCSPRSGSTFPLGTTTVTCSATNAHHVKTTGSFTVTVHDTTPPTLHLPADRVREATSPAGREVRFHARATDAVDGSDPVTCAPASGSIFPVGVTTVECSATDAAGNTATGSFTVTIQDTRPPKLDLPDHLKIEATGPSGAEVDFTPTATDIVDVTDPVTCLPEPGSTFPIGTTTVHCTATDAAGNRSYGQFDVTVRDTTPPVLHVPSNVTVAATGSAGAAVSFTATASDLVDGSDPVSCSPASGSVFKVGSTTVRCSATDAHGNRATGSFTVTVTSPTRR